MATTKPIATLIYNRSTRTLSWGLIPASQHALEATETPTGLPVTAGASTFPFPFLPVELQRDIIDLLSIRPRLALRGTCHHLHTLIKAPTHSELLSLERTPWAQLRNLYACMDCLCLRPASKFADTSTRGPKGIHGKEPHKRFCIECGLRVNAVKHTSHYAPGSDVIVGGVRKIYCKVCKVLSDDRGGDGTGVCAECHVKLNCPGPPNGKVYVGSLNAKAKRQKKRSEEKRKENLEFLDGFGSDFWESYDPAD